MKRDRLFALALIGGAIAFYYYSVKRKKKTEIINSSDDTGNIYSSNPNGTISPKNSSNEYDVSGNLVKCITAPCYDKIDFYN